MKPLTLLAPNREPSTSLSRRRLLLSGASAALLAACASPARPPALAAPSPELRALLAPTGALRVGVYLGSPTSLVVDSQGRRAGVTHDMGHDLARWLGVPIELAEYQRLADVVEALKEARVDFSFSNASPARAQFVSYGQVLVNVELGYLVPAASRITTIADADSAGVRIGVSEGSSSLASLRGVLRQASLVPVPTLKQAAERLQQGQLDAFATNKGILGELAGNVPGARILAGHWGLEHMAMAIPKGRERAWPELNAFGTAVARDGRLAAWIARAGMPGTVAV